MEKNLVSICVITYNSSKTVISTLESIKNQKYENIELIVSDDASKDNTLEIIQNWLKANSSRFVKTKFITAEKNTGVTGNVNRAVKEACGKYVKIIAGDDELLPEYTTECVEYLEKNPEIEVLFTKVKFIDENKNEITRTDVNYDFFNLSAQEQFQYIIEKSVPYIPTPSVIYKRQVFTKIGFYDERIPMWEDGPYYFSLAKNNIKLHLFDKMLVEYRVLPNSISNSVSFRHRQSIALFYFYDIFTYELKRKPFKAILHCIKFSLMYHSDKKICRKLLDKIEKQKKNYRLNK